jgi:alpha-tubulin suppressor-like RCC1 family protein
MPTPTGQIAASDINSEAKRTSTSCFMICTAIACGDSCPNPYQKLRELAGPAFFGVGAPNQIAFSNFRGKTAPTEGQLWLWGVNASGQLGDNTATSKSSPVQTVSGGSDWRRFDIDCHVVAVKTNNALWAWGCNGSGRLGDNTTTSKSSPVQTVSGGTDWANACPSTWSFLSPFGGSYDEIAVSVYSLATKSNGSLWSWGSNTSGRLGDNSTTTRSSPVQVIGAITWTKVYAGGSHSIAVDNFFRLWAWGTNLGGRLGDNTTTSKSSPVQTISGGTNWCWAGGGQFHTVGLKTDGTLWAWGCNGSGQLGDNTTTTRCSPVQTVSGGSDWRYSTTGSIVDGTTAIKTDGTLWSWGAGNIGRLGNNSTLSRSSPVQTISGGTNWRYGGSAGSSVVSVIKIDGTLWTWGNGATGRLGDNSTVSRSSPVQTIAGGNCWRYTRSNEIAAGVRF